MSRTSLVTFTGLALLASVAATGAAQQGARRAITFDDFAAVKAVSDPQLSPDGRQLLYAVRATEVGANRRTTTTYLAAVASGDAGARAFPDDTTRATEARWSPDGRRVAYVAGGQLWVADANGANRRQLSRLNGGASGPVWAPSGDRIAFVSSVYPECTTDECNGARDKAKDTSKVKAHVADQLMYRHWNAWDEGTRSHLFVVSPDGGAPRDLVPGARYDVPPGPFGGSEGYAFAQDGQTLAFTAKDAGREEAWSTDANVYLVSAGMGTQAPTPITAENKGADQNPVFSPDGRWIAYASQRRAGFESDRWRLMLYDRNARSSRELLPSWDRNADAYVFAGDGSALYIQTVDAGRDKLYRVALDRQGNTASPAPALVTGESNNAAPTVSRDGRTIAWVRDASNRPAEVFVATVGPNGAATGARQFSHANDALVARLDVNPAEEFWTRGAGTDSVQSFLIKPPNYQPNRKYPVILLIHGGPQGAWLDQWHSRWNYQMFAATGSAVVFVNPRGSTGYGQRFVDEVSKDWGGKAYTDIMQALDGALRRYPWLDSTRMGAAGGSYGGYMVNWIAGHSNRFKALVTHAGVFNLENMYGATEELWFPEWEYGAAYWDSTAMEQQYRKWSPHLSARNFKTPHLVLHGELDYRVPYYEGVSLFSALQKQSVPSRFVVFPDEGHWVLKPQNQRLWWNEVQGWLTKYLTSDGRPRT
ncbi:MAG TPA: S9 family peptidase [Gemmatimonadaceae bacterium]|nr:S9 family peptidase [Gemmatimonadaceae bacterium]